MQQSYQPWGCYLYLRRRKQLINNDFPSPKHTISVLILVLYSLLWTDCGREFVHAYDDCIKYIPNMCNRSSGFIHFANVQICTHWCKQRTYYTRGRYALPQPLNTLLPSDIFISIWKCFSILVNLNVQIAISCYSFDYTDPHFFQHLIHFCVYFALLISSIILFSLSITEAMTDKTALLSKNNRADCRGIMLVIQLTHQTPLQESSCRSFERM